MGLPPKDKFCLGFVFNEDLGFYFGFGNSKADCTRFRRVYSRRRPHTRARTERERERERETQTNAWWWEWFFFVRKRALLDFKREKAVCSISISFLTADCLLPEKEREREIKRERVEKCRRRQNRRDE